jgi:predicted oxidoreductase
LNMQTFQPFSKVIAGCMKWGNGGAHYSPAEMASLIQSLVDAGITSFDHADIYGDYQMEGSFGKALASISRSKFRASIQIISKCGICKPVPEKNEYVLKHYNTTKAHIIASCERSLRHLQTDYLDAFLIHRPDPLMQAAEIAEAFTELQKQGKVLRFGVSNFTVTQCQLLDRYFPLSIHQLEASAIHLQPFQDGSLDYLQMHQKLPMAWSPLGGGKLLSSTEPNYERVRGKAGEIAEKYGLTTEQVLLIWLLTHPSNIHPVIGSTQLTRLMGAADISTMKLDRTDWYQIWTASTGEKLP